ncbi:hypothetical protein CCR75_005523 [Bremia lactucae]|uniref:Uncharacterized protein n=1 Tax=Bremia lactucae TaxID=4779 RepID=A0A976IC94_BRELC|nr:hypothetical protein CCR75_005523 [Bremia lactucae]
MSKTTNGFKVALLWANTIHLDVYGVVIAITNCAWFPVLYFFGNDEAVASPVPTGAGERLSTARRSSLRQGKQFEAFAAFGLLLAFRIKSY